MSTRTSKVKVALEASGGGKVAQELDRVGKSTERVGKQQTRLGQASASAGRSFAAQSQGLGGVVGVYAAAAANVFALTAAFTALNRAAQFETIIKGTEQLANAVGSSSQRVVSGLKDITNGQLSIVEAATQANLALSAGFNSKQINELAEVSLKASRALGRNLTDSFQRITRGAIKLEPELLDEIGIFTRIEPAVEAYAASLNKSASQLTQFERRQAFVNQVIKDGQRAFADIVDSGETTQEVFEKLVANFSDLAIQAGLLVAKALEPLARFLDQSLGNRIVLLGSVALLVFNSLRTALSTFVIGGFSQLNEVLEQTAMRFTKVSKSSAAFGLQAQDAVGAFVGGGAFQGAGRATGANLKRRLSEGNISLREARVLRSDIKLLQQNELNLQQAINEERRDTGKVTAETQKQLAQSEIRQKGLAKASEAVDTKIKNAGRGANALAAGLNLAAAGARTLGTALSVGLAILNTFVAVLAGAQLIFSFFGVDLFSTLSDFIQSLGKDARDTASGLDELANAFKRAGNAGTIFGDSDPAAVLAQADAAILQAEKRARIAKKDPRAGVLGGVEESLNAQLAIAQAALEDADTLAEEAEAKAKIAGILLAQSGIIPTLRQQALAITRISELSERSGKIIADSFVNDGLIRISEDGKQVIATLGDATVAIGDFKNGTFTSTKELSGFGASAGDAQQKIAKLNKDLKLGVISAEIASRDLITIRTLLDSVKDTSPEFEAELKKLLDPVEKIANDFIKLDQIAKSIRKEFSGDLQLADTAVTKGLVSAGGEFARTQEEARKNRAEFLSLTKLTFEALIKENAAQTNINAAQDAFLAAQKAAFGFNLKNVIATSEQVKQEQKKLDKLQQQNNILQLQVNLATKQAGFEAARLTNELALQSRKNALKLAEASLETVKAERKTSEIIAKNRKEQNDLLREALTLQLRIAGIRAERSDVRAADADARIIRDIEEEKQKVERTGFASRRQLVDLEIKLERARAAARLRELERSEAQARREAGEALIATQARRDALGDEALLREQALRNSLEILAKEKALRDTERSIEIQKQENIKEAATNQLNALDDGLVISKAQIDANKADQLAQLDIISKKYEFLRAEIEANNKFLAEESKLIDGLLKGVAALKGINKEEAITAGEIGLGNIEESQRLLQSSADLIKSNATLQSDLAEQNVAKQKATLNAAVKGAQAEIDLLNDLESRQNSLNDAKKAALEAEIKGVQDTLAQKLKNLDLEDAATLETLKNKLIIAGLDRDAAEAVLSSAIEQAEYALTLQARLDSALAKSKTIVADYVDSGLMQLNDALIEGTFTFKALARGFRDMLGNMLRDIQRAVFQETVSKPIAEGIAGFLPKLFTAGGLAHLAAGGTMKRDRVAAMLEPGEFVIRKEAAKKLGMSQLQKMNAGIEPDPLARLIAMFNGSKVRGRAGGGDIRNEGAFSGGASFGSSSYSYGGGGGGGQSIPAFSMAEKQRRDPVGFAQAEIARAQIQKQLDMGNDITQSDALSIFQSPGVAAKAVGQSRIQNPSRAGAGLLLSATPLAPIGAAFGVGSALGDFFRAMGATVEDDRMKAAGGPVHMAGGGAVKSRDRVPALLEPGEFVIRRPMAKAIGGAALNQMNATGRPPQVSVNMTNQGAPKDVTVAQPKMNGDKIILDIITRDLRNNGAIKKSLRKNR